jgi:hypothetical protein
MQICKFKYANLKRAAIAAVFSFCILHSALCTDVLFPFINTARLPQGTRQMDLFTLAAPSVDSTNLVTVDIVRKTTGTNGTITYSNLVGETYYRAEFKGQWGVTTNWFFFPETNVLLNASDARWLRSPTNTSSGMAYSAAQSDARYVRSAAGPGTNNTFLSPLLQDPTITNAHNLFLKDNFGDIVGGHGAVILDDDTLRKNPSVSGGIGTVKVKWLENYGELSCDDGSISLDWQNRRGRGADGSISWSWDVIGLMNSTGDYLASQQDLADLVISGSQIQNGTVNSNKLDAATAAQLALAGQNDTNLTKLLIAQNAGLPEARIHTNGTFTFNGTNFPITSTASAGVLDALALAPPMVWPKTNLLAGLKIKFDPGIFYTTTNIWVWCSNTPYSFILEGSGEGASGLVNVGTATQECLTIGRPNCNNSLSFQVRDLTIANNVNGLTNVVHIYGYNDPGASGAGGGIAKGLIERCYIGYWASMTNADRYGPDGAGDTYKHNLVALNVDCNFDNFIVVRDNDLVFSACSALAGDHIVFENNMILDCGNGQHAPLTNDWPITSPFSAQAGVVCRQPGNGLFTQNGQSWSIRGNVFVNTPIHYASFFYIDGSGNIGWGPNERYAEINSFTVYDDRDENGSYLAVTSGNPIRFINPRRDHSSTPYLTLPSLVWTNKNDLRTPPTGISTGTMAPPTNLIEVSDIILHSNVGGWTYGGTLTAPLFNGPANAVTTEVTNRWRTEIANSNANYMPLSGGTMTGTRGITNVVIYGNGGVLSYDSTLRKLYTSLGAECADLGNTQLKFPGGGTVLNWGGQTLTDTAGNDAIKWSSAVRDLCDFAGATSVAYGDRILFDSSGTGVLDWENRQLLYSDGATVLMDLSSGIINNSAGATMIDLNSKNWATERIYYYTGSTYLLRVDVLNNLLLNLAGTPIADWSGASFKSTIATNSGAGTFVDFNSNHLNSVLLQTNASFVFRGFQNMNGTNWSRCIMWVTNSGASTITMTPPAGCITNGVWLVTNAGLTEVDWDVYGSRFTNGVAKPIK